MTDRHQARRDDANIRDTLRQRQLMQTVEIGSGKERGTNIGDVTSEVKNKQKGKQMT